jgi:hypothetical protein
MRRIVVVFMVGILIGPGYALWQCSAEDAPSGQSSLDERFKVADLGVAPDPKATGATEEGDFTVEEKIAWGKESLGQVANLRVLTPAAQPGEPIEFEVRVKNVSDKDTHLPSGLGSEKMSACFWTFYFDQWEWRPSQLSCRVVPLKPGETASVRCLVATTRESLTADQKERFRFSPPAPFRHVQNKTESDRLPEGSYRVRAMLNDRLESNLIEVRIINSREQSNAADSR